MPSVVDLCNDALSHTGTDITIASLEESSKEAKICARWYPRVRDELLRSGKGLWNFANRRVILAQVAGTPPSGWAYQYRYPVDCLFLGQVFPTGSYSPLSSRHRFEVASDADGGRLVLTDQPEAEAIYVHRITDPNLFDDLFRSCLEYALAAKIAMPLTSDAKMVDYLRNLAKAEASAALEGTLSEAEEGRMPEADSVRVRFAQGDDHA